MMTGLTLAALTTWGGVGWRLGGGAFTALSDIGTDGARACCSTAYGWPLLGRFVEGTIIWGEVFFGAALCPGLFLALHGGQQWWT